MHITLIEDDVDLGQAVTDHLAAQGHAVEWLKTAGQARAAFSHLGEHRNSDLALLDLGLPDGDGMDILTEVRAQATPLPVLVLSARDQIRDRIRGLATGADDYLVKPFDLDELSARVDAVARRYALTPSPVLHLVGGAQVELQTQLARRGNLTLSLTAMEWALLRCLAVHPGQTWSKDALTRRIYPHGEGSDSNTLEVLISRLRKKLGPESICTTRALGYRLERVPTLQ